MNVGDLNILADEPLHDIEIVNHQVEHNVNVQRSRGELTDAMNLKIDWLANVRSQRNHRGIEALEVSDLENCVALFGCADHPIRFFERSRYRFFDQDVNARLEQAARNLAVGFSRNSDTRRVDMPDQFTPVRGPLSFPFAADRARGVFVEIADGGELRHSFGGECRVDARVLASEATDSNDCCAQHYVLKPLTGFTRF